MSLMLGQAAAAESELVGYN